MRPRPNYDAVLFDLLTGLLDSWTLWDTVAGNGADGRRWRAAYLRNTYGTGAYRPYETLVAEAAEEVGLPRGLAERLGACYGEIKPWPEAHAVLSALHEHVPLAVVTNCSEHLGAMAAATTGVEFDVLVTAERAASISRTLALTGRRWRSWDFRRRGIFSSRAQHSTCSGQPSWACRLTGITGSVSPLLRMRANRSPRPPRSFLWLRWCWGGAADSRADRPRLRPSICPAPPGRSRIRPGPTIPRPSSEATPHRRTP